MRSVAARVGAGCEDVGPVGSVGAAASRTAEPNDNVAVSEHVGVVAGRVQPLIERAFGAGVPRRNVLAEAGRLTALEAGVTRARARARTVEPAVIEIALVAHVLAVGLRSAIQRSTRGHRGNTVGLAMLVQKLEKALLLLVERSRRRVEAIALPRGEPIPT